MRSALLDFYDSVDGKRDRRSGDADGKAGTETKERKGHPAGVPTKGFSAASIPIGSPPTGVSLMPLRFRGIYLRRSRYLSFVSRTTISPPTPVISTIRGKS